ncbi:hypothetical protein JM79_2778 [Gramella sp. Hel_I_59]|uniref:hypothetical protein n=1 Tax=Gramella sp. Hel_I_59 TaxID=1249978 RepID=UPI001153F160|nr:hypothetical protein [Gramella sp. Hel_I_59]TQI71829.1 hypothetical protein JM79_2778 [Gramella sp. Hel_I_59]
MKIEEAVEANKLKVKEAFNYRKLPFSELSNCSLSNSRILSWNFKDLDQSGESLGYFNKDFTQFFLNWSWSERMRIKEGNPTPVCCNFKMRPSTKQKPEDIPQKWSCSQCGRNL